MADNCEPVANKRRKKELTWVDRKDVFVHVFHSLSGGAPAHGIFARLGSNLSVGPETVSKCWKKLRAKLVTEYHWGEVTIANKDTFAILNLPDEFFFTKKVNSGQNSRKHCAKAIGATLDSGAIPQENRSTVQETAFELNMPTTSFLRVMKEGAAVKRSSRVKPILTEVNKLSRLEYCLAQLDNSSAWQTRSNLRFKDQMNTIMVDEKWFFKTRVIKSVYCGPNEEPRKCTTRHKSHIDKVMFLCAQARPRKVNGHWTCDIETFRAMMVNNVLTSIQAFWPESDFNNKRIRLTIQQDGAPGHFEDWEHEWLDCVSQMGLTDKIELVIQPANSPDLNLLDLGLFRAFEAVYKKMYPKTFGEILECVDRAYWNYPHHLINRMWLTHMSVMNEIIECHGCNDYKIPHMNKRKLEAEGNLPRVLEVTDAVRIHLPPTNQAPEPPAMPPLTAGQPPTHGDVIAGVI